MERFRCQSRCQGQRVTKEILDPLVHREFLAEMAETANKGQQERLGHKVLLVHKARRERKAHREFLAKMVCLDRRETSAHKAFLALLDETAETANKVLLVLLVLLARRERRATKETKATLEAHLPTSCLST